MKSKYDILDWELKVKRSSAGCGLFATKEIPKGVCLIEYFGRQISEAEHTRVTVNTYLELIQKSP